MTKLSAFEKALLSGQSFTGGPTVESLEKSASAQRNIQNILGGVGDFVESGVDKTAGGIANLLGYGSSILGYEPEVGAKFFDMGEKFSSGDMRKEVERKIAEQQRLNQRAGPKSFFRKSPPELTPRNTTSEFNKAQLEKFGGFDNLGIIPKYSSEALKNISKFDLRSIDKDLSALQESLKEQPLKEMQDITKFGQVPPEGIRFDRQNRKIENTSGLPDEYVEDRLGGTKDESDVIERDLTQKEGVALQDAYMQTMQSISDTPAKGKTLEDYKKEFAEATGIDPSGKIDKSDALMAFGLALLQNRAGKGFSAALRGIGQAGEKAQPLLMEAKKQAKAERLAAGKYALDMVKRDEDSAAATAAAHDAFQREIFLKNYEAELEMATFAQKQLLEGKDPTEIKSPGSRLVSVGAKDYKISTALEGSKTIYTNAPTDANTIMSAHRKASDGLSSIRQMEILADKLDLTSGDYVGGAAGKLLMQRAQSLLTSMGIGDKDQFFAEVGNLKDDEGNLAFEGVSIESNIEIIRDALLARFKRFLSQETGNGISNIDMELLQTQAGTVSLFTNPAEYKARLAQLKKPFMDSLRITENELNNMTDRYFYAEGDDGTKAFDKTQEAISAGLLEAINPIMSYQGILQGRSNIDVSDQ
tara:strand:+ start:3041 stop:4972 length:1932 start_codon:yes stop_codon:yes gene_type:complete